MIKLIKKVFFGIELNKYTVGSYSVEFSSRKHSSTIIRHELCRLCNTFVERTVGAVFIRDESPTSDVELKFCQRCSCKYNLATKDEKEQRIALALLKMKELI